MSTFPVMTYLARPADPGAPPPPDGNLAVAAIEHRLVQSGSRYERVASLRDIARSLHALARMEEYPATIQIIGHGAPGLLALGYYWNPAKYTDTNEGPFYLLDSNPYAYGLLEPFLQHTTRVILAGCNVGSNHRSLMVARGRELIFDLYAMWGCDVLAADGMVGPEHFVDGRFAGAVQGYVRRRWVRAPGCAARERADPDRTVAWSYHDVKLVAIPALGSVAPSDVPSIDTTPLHGYVRELTTNVPRLAMQEMSFTATDLQGRSVELHIVGNAEYLMAVCKDQGVPSVRWFTTERQATRWFEPDADSGDYLGVDSDDAADPGSALWASVKRALRDRLLA